MEENTSTGEETTSSAGDENPFAGLFAGEHESEVPTTPTENAPVEAEATPSNDGEVESAPTAVDDLFAVEADGGDDEAQGWDGKSPLNEHPRFKQIVKQRNAARDKLALLEAQMKDLENTEPEVVVADPVVQELWGDYENPVEAMKADAEFIQDLLKMKTAGVDGIDHFIEKVYKPWKNGDTPTTTTPSQEEEETTAMSEEKNHVNELAMKLAKREWTDEIDSVLTATKIRPELRSVIERAVLNQVDVSSESSTKAVQDAALAVIKDYGWDMEFLTGGKAKPKDDLKKPTPGTAGAAAKGASKAEETSKESQATEPDPDENPHETFRNQLRELVASSGAQA